MKAAPHIHAEHAASLTDNNVIVDSHHCDCSQAYRRVPQTSPGVQHHLSTARNYIPSWIGGTAPQILNASTQSLVDMLRVLKFATETYLGAQVTNATISVPFSVGWGRVDSSSLDVRLDAAASAFNIKLSSPRGPVSDITWDNLETKKWKRSPYTYFSCHPDDEGFVLGIDFNNAALTATILVPDCGDGDTFYYSTRVLHSTELGARRLFTIENWRETLVHALRRVTALPIRGVETDHINMLVLLGDSARDQRLRHALQDVLGDQYDRLISSARDDGTPAQDPQYRGAASAAHDNWDWYHYRTPYREFGCVSPGPHPYSGPTVFDYVKEAYGVIREWFRSTAEKNAEAELAAAQERKRLLKELAQHPILIGAQ